MLELIFLLVINLFFNPVVLTETKVTDQTVTKAVYEDSALNTATSTPLLPTATPAVTPAQTQSPTPAPDNIINTIEQTPTPPVEEEKELDYIEELTKLGYIKNDYQEKDINVRNGVLKFQADSNLDADGVYGPNTTAALRKRIKDTNFTYTDEVSSAPTKNYWIFINKSRRILTLYQGSNVVHKYPVAVGNPPSLTPDGHFKILVKVVNPAWGGGGYAQPVPGGVPENPLGYRWMGLDLGGGGEYGIHGNNAPYSIGTYASHGCIRMINSDVESLYEIVPEGTPVWIGTDDSLEKNGITQREYK